MSLMTTETKDFPPKLFACFYRDERDGKLHLFNAITPVCSSLKELEERVMAFQKQTLEVTGKSIELFVHPYFNSDPRML